MAFLMTQTPHPDPPSLHLLTDDQINQIHQAALNVLENVGLQFDNPAARQILSSAGATVDHQSTIVKIPESLVQESLRHAPSTIQLYDRDGAPSLHLAEGEVHFNPGSSALNLLDRDTGTPRAPTSPDLEAFARLCDALPHIHAQSTAMVVTDVPTPIVDRYRLYLVLKNTTKPIITGAFTQDGIDDMHKLLVAVRGDDATLKTKPLAIFDACPSPPLKWSAITSQNIIDCAKHQLPIELISMPQLGATSPATLAGALVQHTAETLSGLVLAQLVQPKTPVIYGGSPTLVDMRFGTACLGSMEVWMQCSAFAQLGRFYNLPTHAYMGLSDAKLVDTQAGFEAGMGLLLAALAGINNVAGPGMLSFENCQSFEKLVIDNELCGTVYRLHQGIKVNPATLAQEIIADIGPGGHFLAHPHTAQWFPHEEYIPSQIIDKRSDDQWVTQGSKNTATRAKETVDHILQTHQPPALDNDTLNTLDHIVKAF